MRLVIQRVREASVTVSESTVGSIGTGLVVLLGVSRSDTADQADYLLDKLLGLRIFPDEQGKMNPFLGALFETEWILFWQRRFLSSGWPSAAF